MKTIGLIGGMSWESTVTYYQLLNRGVQRELGGLHSASLIMASVDFAEIERLQHDGDWDALAEILADAAKRIAAAGAEGLMICTNTMHKVADQVEQATDLPLLHIADCTAQELIKDGVSKVGLLGTAFTMQQDFYKGRLQHHEIDVVIPNEEDCQRVHQTIYQELCLGQIHDRSRQEFQNIVSKLAEAGAEAVILGCTEIGLLLRQQDSAVRLYDTTHIHAEAAVSFMLS